MSKEEKKELLYVLRPLMLCSVIVFQFIIYELVKNYLIGEIDGAHYIFGGIVEIIMDLIPFGVLIVLIVFVIYPIDSIRLIKSISKLIQDSRCKKREKKQEEMQRQVLEAEALLMSYGEKEEDEFKVIFNDVIQYLREKHLIVFSSLSESPRDAFYGLLRNGILKLHSTDFHGKHYDIVVKCKKSDEQGRYDIFEAEGVPLQQMPKVRTHVTSEREKELSERRKKKKLKKAQPKQNFESRGRKWAEQHVKEIQDALATGVKKGGVLKAFLDKKELPARESWVYIGKRLEELGEIDSFVVKNNGIELTIN